MVDYSERFGERCQEIMRASGENPNTVELKSRKRISHATVRRMVRGYPPSSDLIVEFADATGRTPEEREEWADELLRLAEKRVAYRVPVSVRCGAGFGQVPVAA